jgi:glycogen phosphorylase
VGWALGDGKEHGDNPAWDAVEAEELYVILEQQVVPEFYTRDANGIPNAWVARMRNSMGRLTPRFSANRAVLEYTEQYYIPAAQAYRERTADNSAFGARLVNWRRAVEQNWSHLRFGEMSVATDGGKHVFEIHVYLNDLAPDAVRVELYAEGINGEEPERREMERSRQLVGASGYLYRAELPATRPASDYTARVMPYCSAAAIPLEASRILWQR